MEAATTEEKFHHAVELIQNLPKSGGFQPSNDLKLKFYSYFKQATVGPCDSPKPRIWDVVSRAKWDAWSRLGGMAKEEAMKHYVDEFIEILKTQPFDEKAHEFVNLMGPFIDFAPKEFQDKYKGITGSETDSQDYILLQEGAGNNYKASKIIKRNNGNASDDVQDEKLINGHNLNGTTQESDCEEFSDTFDQANEELSEEETIEHSVLYEKQESNFTQSRGGGEKRVGKASGGDIHSPILGSSGNKGNHGSHRRRGANVPSHHYPGGMSAGSSGGGGKKDDDSESLEPVSDVSEQLAFAVIRLQHTMEQVVNRLDSLEALLQEKKSNNFVKVDVSQNSFWNIFGIPLRTALLILGWPFLAHWIIYVIQRRRRK